MKRSTLGMSVMLLVVGLAGQCLGCAHDANSTRTSTINVGAAEPDAKAAIALGDRRLIGVYGFTVEVPGTTEDVATLRQKYGLRMLEGTGDDPKGSQDRVFNQLARQYAAKYNEVILAASR